MTHAYVLEKLGTSNPPADWKVGLDEGVWPWHCMPLLCASGVVLEGWPSDIRPSYYLYSPSTQLSVVARDILRTTTDAGKRITIVTGSMYAHALRKDTANALG